MLRKIVKIDEERCNGCGLCVPSCAEGAIQIVEGKARLVSETYCDGLGACLGECPQNAISIEERDAELFDEVAAERHVKATAPQPAAVGLQAAHHIAHHAGCPGSMARTLPRTQAAVPAETGQRSESFLSNWPLQLALAPIRAPYFQGARLSIVADCVPASYPDFQRRFVAGRTLTIGCPKLDNAGLYREKLAHIFQQNDVQAIEVAYMEVPCCFGLVHLVRQSLQDAAKDIPLTLTRISIGGEIIESINHQD